MALRTSATVPEPAESVTNRALLAEATMPASEVFPVPAGPQSTMEPRRSAEISDRRGPAGPTRCDCPTRSSRLWGRMRAARGAKASKCSSAACVKRLSTMSFHGTTGTTRFRRARCDLWIDLYKLGLITLAPVHAFDVLSYTVRR